mmetsp:Transcript_15417/g.43374  ORF Transcript_15417/g.43374 Transcript_15417/m.43374 type:complete len:245 (-) Transcript_15417:116-850(-)
MEWYFCFDSACRGGLRCCLRPLDDVLAAISSSNVSPFTRSFSAVAVVVESDIDANGFDEELGTAAVFDDLPIIVFFHQDDAVATEASGSEDAGVSGAVFADEAPVTFLLDFLCSSLPVAGGCLPLLEDDAVIVGVGGRHERCLLSLLSADEDGSNVTLAFTRAAWDDIAPISASMSESVSSSPPPIVIVVVILLPLLWLLPVVLALLLLLSRLYESCECVISKSLPSIPSTLVWADSCDAWTFF